MIGGGSEFCAAGGLSRQRPLMLKKGRCEGDFPPPKTLLGSLRALSWLQSGAAGRNKAGQQGKEGIVWRGQLPPDLSWYYRWEGLSCVA
jgi:hypothetical protein